MKEILNSLELRLELPGSISARGLYLFGLGSSNLGKRV